jgi:APA family basic amino acid/polyamine antiporter
LSIFGAVILGMGSIIGAGVFVGIGIAAGIAGPAVILATIIAAAVAACNGLSSAQLAASHPVSGGAYEYGYKYLNPTLGFIAGWMFLCAKSASAATAALGFAGYVLSLFEITGIIWRIGLGLAAVIVLTAIILCGLRQSNALNLIMVTIPLGALLFFIAAGLPRLADMGFANFVPFFVPPSAGTSPLRTVIHAAALMFVAYTGYGRIATLGEEVREPQRTIPRAIIITLLAAMLLYVAVAVVAVGLVGADQVAMITEATSAPLQVIASSFGIQGAGAAMVIGAITAMLGVQINLHLSLARVVLAMGRRHDMPAVFARIDKNGKTPELAVAFVGVIVAVLVLIGNVETTWSFSAFTVLIYYAITNLAALSLPAEKRRYPHAVATLGLLASLFLAFWVEPSIWIAGLAVIAVGLIWQWIIHKV